MKNLNVVLVIMTALCLSFISCQNKQTQEELAKFKQIEATEAVNIEIVKQGYAHLDKFMNETDRKAFIDLYSADSKCFGGSAEQSISLEDMVQFITLWYSAFPDLTHQLNNIIAKGDYVVVQVKYTGTQEKEFMGIPASGKKIESKGVHIFKLAEGKITEMYTLDDDFTMFQQLGQELKSK